MRLFANTSGSGSLNMWLEHKHRRTRAEIDSFSAVPPPKRSHPPSLPLSIRVVLDSCCSGSGPLLRTSGICFATAIARALDSQYCPEYSMRRRDGSDTNSNRTPVAAITGPRTWAMMGFGSR